MAEPCRTVGTATAQRIAGSYPSFQPPGGLAPGILRHLGAAVPPAQPHDRRVRIASPGQTRPAAMAGNPHPPQPYPLSST